MKTLKTLQKMMNNTKNQIKNTSSLEQEIRLLKKENEALKKRQKTQNLFFIIELVLKN